MQTNNVKYFENISQILTKPLAKLTPELVYKLDTLSNDFKNEYLLHSKTTNLQHWAPTVHSTKVFILTN